MKKRSDSSSSAKQRDPSVSEVTMLEGEPDELTVGFEQETVPLPQREVPSGEGVSTIVAKEPPTAAEETKQAMEEPVLPSLELATEEGIAPDPEAGEQIEHYDLIELLGKGGAGSVFKARDRRSGKVVALKVLAAKKLRKARVVQRFVDEARAAETVRHECLVQLLEFIEVERPRRLAYAMEYVQGISLRAHLQKEKALHLTEAIHIARQMSRGVGELHKAGIIHRDLKPENIMIIPAKNMEENPQVKVLDFGVAKFLTGDGIQSEGPGTFVGTPRYMAPEQAAGGQVDARSDLFAIGVMLFEMITGSRPHDGDTLKSVVMAKLKGAPRIEINPGREILPQELSDVVDSCLKLKPAERPSSTKEFDQVLSAAYIVLSAVGPIRLVDDVVERDIKSELPSVPRRNSKLALDDEGENISTYVMRGGASDDFRRKEKLRSRRKKKRLPPTVRKRPMEAPGQSNQAKVVPIKPEIAPRKRKVRATSPLLQLFAVSILFGVGIYMFIDGGFIASDTAVEFTTPVPIPVEPQRLIPYDILVNSEPIGARIIIDDVVVGKTPHRIRIPGKVQSVQASFILVGYERKVLTLTRALDAEMMIKLDSMTDSEPKLDENPGGEPDAPGDFSELEIEE